MAAAQKLGGVVERLVDHGDRVYTLDIRPERAVPRFRPGQFLHLALDRYDPAGFWPESRPFSIASPPAQRDLVRITYAVHGRFTARMERELAEGRPVWVKLPYGAFEIDVGRSVVLIAGGTGITAFSAFLSSAPTGQAIVLAYGARTRSLLIYRELVEECARRLPALEAIYFVEEEDDGVSGTPDAADRPFTRGRITVEAVWRRLERPFDMVYYLAGPPAMLRAVADDLRGRNIAPEAIHIDAWE